MTEEKKRGGCVKAAGIGAGVVLVLGVIGALAGGKGPAPSGETEVAAAPPTAITARELHSAYDANEVAAKTRFADQRLAVTGIVAGVDLDMFDNPVVLLETANEFQPVQAKFEKSAAGRTGALAKGQEITVICGKVTEVIGSPILNDCTLP